VVPGLARALAAFNAPNALHLWLVTAGVQQVAGDVSSVDVMHSPVWGLGRIVAREHPELRCTNLDLRVDAPNDELALLPSLLARDTREEMLALRGTRLLALRYQRAEATDASHVAPSVTFRPDASYLVTGGLSGIGILTARWLADHGARHLVLVARRAPSDEVRAHIADMEASGVSVEVRSADLADRAQVDALIASVDTAPLRGIFHLAVVTGDALLDETTPEQFERVFAGKAVGAWNLYQATRHLELDHCLFFSSVATLIAQPGQGAYAAANAFLDALARHGRAHQVPVSSVQWGPWIGGGLSAQEGKQRSVRAYAEQGVHPMQPALGFAVLERVVAQSITQPHPVTLAAAIDWRAYAEYRRADDLPPTWSELVPTERVQTKAAPEAPVDLKALLHAEETGRALRAALEQFLRTGLARVLKIDPAKIDLQKPVGSMGVDSLMAMEFVRRLSASAGVRLPATAVFNHPTLRQLAGEVARRMDVPLDAAVAATPAEVATTPLSAPLAVPHLDELSEEDILRSLTASPEPRS
jgi:NAD(P)-dependent dehydrogenase (short-subunit alcohol dehydrogenase family)/acyl carrier protein